VCPSFADCLYTSQSANLVPATDLFTDAAAGTLPSYAIVTPTAANSQHNSDSMSQGDNWIGQVVSALQASPDWSSTALFITYDDCGCFYDHVNPLQYNANWGVRLPMAIVSPYVRAGYTDHHATSLGGIVAFVEYAFNLPPMNSTDSSTYNYSSAFCFPGAKCIRAGLAPVPTKVQAVPAPTPAQAALQAQASDDDT
jgi:phospholipase C